MAKSSTERSRAFRARQRQANPETPQLSPYVAMVLHRPLTQGELNKQVREMLTWPGGCDAELAELERLYGAEAVDAALGEVLPA